MYKERLIMHVRTSMTWLQKAAVDATLEDMGVAHKPRIVMYNKVDALSEVGTVCALLVCIRYVYVCVCVC